MDYPFKTITKEDDLDFYEEYIKKSEHKNENKHINSYFYTFLQENINKMVRIDFYNCKTTEFKIGILSFIGEDFIILHQPRYKRKICCDMKSVKFITVIGNKK